jgi:DNA-binding transcriptional regulator YhcF (GntR family)
VTAPLPQPPAITIDAQLPIPPYEQIRRQISDLIRAGVLVAGVRLPPVRQLATDLGLAVGTVARAYQELEAAGLVATSRGGGTRVLPQAEPTGTRRASMLAQLAQDYVASARRLGAHDAETLSALHAALHAGRSTPR